MFNIRLIIIFFITVLFLFSSQTLACVGARPLGMGGGFISIANDENATYWNPAGLSRLKAPKFAVTFTLTNKDQMGYRSFISYVKPNLGLSYISRLRSNNDLEEWYTLSISQLPHSRLSVGLNLRYEIHSLSKNEFHTDLGLIYSPNSFLNLGFLFQSLNNLRPSASLNFKSLKIGFDIYDVLCDPRVLAGIEWQLDNSLTLRLGLYANDLTFGASAKLADISLSFAILMRKSNILLLTIGLPQR